MVHEQWGLSPKAIVYAQPYVDRFEGTCPEMLAVQVARLVALAKSPFASNDNVGSEAARQMPLWLRHALRRDSSIGQNCQNDC